MIYQFLKQIIRASLFFFFKKILISGKEHIPEKGPLIIVANHPNTLMDPLLIAALTGQRIGFVANASIFLNKIITKIFNYFHVIPIYRKKDVLPGEKPDNRKAFVKCHEYLDQHGTLLIFPEGTSYYELKLREIKTGTARIALSYEELKSFKGNLKIIPIALDYSDSIQFRSIVSVSICKAIDVGRYKQAYEANEFEAVSQLTEDIRKELAEIVPQTSGKEQEEFLVNAHHFYTTFYSPAASLQKNPKQSLELRTQVSKALQLLKTRNLELYLDTQSKLTRFFKIMKEERIDPALISAKLIRKYSMPVIVFQFLTFLFLFPFYFLGMFFNYIPYILPAKIFRAMKLDIEYRSPVQMIIGLICFPIYYGLIIYVYRVFINDSFWQSLILLIVMPLMGYVSMFYYAEVKRFSKLCRYKFLIGKSKKLEIDNLKDAILNNIEAARRNLELSIQDS